MFVRVLQAEGRSGSAGSQGGGAVARGGAGTVHKVQGREAGSVIIVLSASLSAQRGTRAWTGGQPDILNVAVTRVQENLYVVRFGSAGAHVGLFSELAASRSFPSHVRKTSSDGKETGSDEREVAQDARRVHQTGSRGEFGLTISYLNRMSLDKGDEFLR